MVEAAELSRPFTPSSPALQPVPGRVEDPQFVVTAVRDHDPPVGELRGIPDPVKHVVVLALTHPDRDRRHRSDLPHPRPFGRLGILADPDARAVAGQGEEVGPTVLIRLAPRHYEKRRNSE